VAWAEARFPTAPMACPCEWLGTIRDVTDAALLEDITPAACVYDNSQQSIIITDPSARSSAQTGPSSEARGIRSRKCLAENPRLLIQGSRITTLPEYVTGS